MSEEFVEKRKDPEDLVKSSKSSSNDEIDLVQVTRLLLGAWKLIVGVTALTAAVALAYAFTAPEVYRTETLLAHAAEEKPNLPSAFSQFGGLAGFAGINVPADSDKEQVLATLTSREFLTRFIKEKNLLPVLFSDKWDESTETWILGSDEDPPSMNQAFRVFSESVMSVVEDRKTGLVTLSIDWRDPEVTAEWANELVSRLNKDMQDKALNHSVEREDDLREQRRDPANKSNDMQQVLYRLIESEKQKHLMAKFKKEFALKVIDPAVVPEFPEKPKRKLIVFIGGVCGLLLGVFSVFLREFFRKLRQPAGSEAGS